MGRTVASRQPLWCFRLRSHLGESQSMIAATIWRWKCCRSAVIINCRPIWRTAETLVPRTWTNVFLLWKIAGERAFMWRSFDTYAMRRHMFLCRGGPDNKIFCGCLDGERVTGSGTEQVAGRGS